VWINDTLPTGVTFVSSSVPYTSVSGTTYGWIFSNVAVGTHTLTIRVQVNGAGADGSRQTNTAKLVYTDQLGARAGSDQAWSNFTLRRPQITIVKVVTPSNAVPGQTVTFTIYYNNTGSRRASTVSIVDSLPTGLIYQGSKPRPTAISGSHYYWNFTNVGVGSHRITLTAQVAANAQGTQLVNWAFLNYTIHGYQLPGSRSSAVVAIPELSDFAFVVAVPFLIVGLRHRARRKATRTPASVASGGDEGRVKDMETCPGEALNPA
jgi:uncharacterized repeat protein (TIGR01451 family)